ncbi:dolichol kinase [Candidatus Mancarchaeum acidiphilum]|uniref:Dolichol kinase n=1 Tax=Candidatus Mancarchaeum acidiphilum TaxID=1920749 RepID=A0A218NMM4_9ARCH|nr:hypothetical protein [Candidatus Mancarchaeum acidiphilum]ASI13712.1 dolichol kinase [Candidatus Mancarchaeum acidiphilum]
MNFSANYLVYLSYSLILFLLILIEYKYKFNLIKKRKASIFRINNLALEKLVQVIALSLVIGAVSLFSHSTLLVLASILIADSSYLLLGLYGVDKKLFIAFTALLIALVILYANNGLLLNLALRSISIGSLFGLEAVYLNFSKKSNGTTHIETDRDLFELTLGVIVISIIFILPKYYMEIIPMLILLGYIFNSYIYDTDKGFASLFHELERRSDIYGFGALTLAFGTMLIISFATVANYAAFFLIVLFFSDSAATIFGIKFNKLKLPYNSKKTVSGTLAFFAIGGILGYLLVGPIAILISVVLALVESLPIKMDDNITLSIASILIFYIIVFA